MLFFYTNIIAKRYLRRCKHFYTDAHRYGSNCFHLQWVQCTRYLSIYIKLFKSTCGNIVISGNYDPDMVRVMQERCIYPEITSLQVHIHIIGLFVGKNLYIPRSLYGIFRYIIINTQHSWQTIDRSSKAPICVLGLYNRRDVYKGHIGVWRTRLWT